MLFSRYAVARLLAAASLIATACAGSASPVTNPAAGPPPSTSVAPRSTAPAVKATASLTGIVRSAATQAPLPRARVTLTSTAISVPRVTIAGRDGRYAFEKLPAGAYTVHASASGYAAQFHGQRPTGLPTPVTIADGQPLATIDIDLPSAGVIVGRVLDEDQRPFAGATVEALVPRTENRQPTLVPIASAVTDDRGDFRLTGLAEGQYYVSAFDPAFAEVGDDTGPLRYSATYYPGVVFAEEARRVSVTPGSEPKTPIIFALKIVRPARISGTITTPERRQLTSGAVLMAPVRGEGLTAVPSDDVRIDPRGAFTFGNVPPGHYQILARAETDPKAAALFATFRLVVSGRDIDDVALTLLPGALVEGTVAFEPSVKPAAGTLAGLRVRAPFADGLTFGDVPSGEVAPDGRYRIRGVMSGRHFITVEGLPYPWVVKDVKWRDRDITDSAIDVDPRQVLDGVRVTLTDVANELSGTVRDARGRLVHEALVMVVPAAPQFWSRAGRRFALRRTDREGQYHVRGLPAGEYRAVASLDLDESDFHRRGLLEQVAEHGQALTLGAPRAHVLDLGLTPLARLTRTSGD